LPIKEARIGAVSTQLLKDGLRNREGGTGGGGHNRGRKGELDPVNRGSISLKSCRNSTDGGKVEGDLGEHGRGR